MNPQAQQKLDRILEIQVSIVDLNKELELLLGFGETESLIFKKKATAKKFPNPVGEKKTGRGRTTPPEVIKEIESLLANDVSVEDICSELHVAKNTVYKIKNKNKGKKHKSLPTSDIVNKRIKKEKPTIEEVRDLIDEGYNSYSIAEEYDVTLEEANKLITRAATE